MKKSFFLTIAILGLFIISSAFAQTPLPGDTPAKMVHIRALKSDLEAKIAAKPDMIHLKALKHKMEQDSAMFAQKLDKQAQQITTLQNELNALKSHGGSTTTPTSPATVTLNMDSAAFAKLFDSLKKFGDRRWMNMYGKNTKLAKLTDQMDSLWNYVSSLEGDMNQSRGYATSAQTQNVNRLNKLENVVAGFDTLMAQARNEMKNLAGAQAQVENVLVGDYDRDLSDSQKADLEAIKARVAARKGLSNNSSSCNSSHN